jgi:hypothetical protein
MVGAPSASHCLRARGAHDSRRLIVFFAVVAAHTAALILLAKGERGQPNGTRDQAPPMVWLILPSLSADPSPTVQPEVIPATRLASVPRQRVSPPPPSPVETPPRPAESPAAPHIDWHSQTGSAAARQLAREAEKSRQESALAPPSAPTTLRDAPRARQFGWDYAATHRVQYTPNGALYINLTDRCIYAFPILVLCKIGEGAPPNGNLFQHARDAASGGAQ